MRSEDKFTFYYHADASTLGGFIQEPFSKSIPSQASVSLPSVGGEAIARTGAFNFEETVSCQAAYARVSGRLLGIDGPWSITATAVVEGLNILEVFTADRLVAQVSVEYPRDGSYLKVSLAGSRFTGLRVGGCEITPTLNPRLLCGAKEPITRPVFLQAGREQADRLISGVKADARKDDYKWLIDRFGWMASKQKQGDDQCILASLIDGVNQPFPGTSFGHALDIPDFGRIFLGEVFVCHSSVQVSSFRAELGCGKQANVGGVTAQVRGVTSPPS